MIEQERSAHEVPPKIFGVSAAAKMLKPRGRPRSPDSRVAISLRLPIAADDARRLYETIALLLSNAPLRRSMGAKARRYAVDQLGQEAVLKELMPRFGGTLECPMTCPRTRRPLL